MANPPVRAIFFPSGGEDREIVCSVLEELGIEVIPEAAPGVIEESPTNELVFIMLDLDSEPDWRSRLRILRAQSPRACLFACSRLGDERLWIDVLEAGAFDFICRPFSRNDVRWIFENALRSHLRHMGPKPAGRESQGPISGWGKAATNRGF